MFSGSHDYFKLLIRSGCLGHFSTALSAFAVEWPEEGPTQEIKDYLVSLMDYAAEFDYGLPFIHQLSKRLQWIPKSVFNIIIQHRHYHTHLVFAASSANGEDVREIFKSTALIDSHRDSPLKAATLGDCMKSFALKESPRTSYHWAAGCFYTRAEIWQIIKSPPLTLSLKEAIHKFLRNLHLSQEDIDYFIAKINATPVSRPTFKHGRPSLFPWAVLDVLTTLTPSVRSGLAQPAQRERYLADRIHQENKRCLIEGRPRELHRLRLPSRDNANIVIYAFMYGEYAAMVSLVSQLSEDDQLALLMSICAYFDLRIEAANAILHALRTQPRARYQMPRRSMKRILDFAGLQTNHTLVSMLWYLYARTLPFPNAYHRHPEFGRHEGRLKAMGLMFRSDLKPLTTLPLISPQLSEFALAIDARTALEKSVFYARLLRVWAVIYGTVYFLNHLVWRAIFDFGLCEDVLLKESGFTLHGTLEFVLLFASVLSAGFVFYNKKRIGNMYVFPQYSLRAIDPSHENDTTIEVAFMMSFLTMFAGVFTRFLGREYAISFPLMVLLAPVALNILQTSWHKRISLSATPLQIPVFNGVHQEHVYIRFRASLDMTKIMDNETAYSNETRFRSTESIFYWSYNYQQRRLLEQHDAAFR